MAKRSSGKRAVPSKGKARWGQRPPGFRDHSIDEVFSSEDLNALAEFAGREEDTEDLRKVLSEEIAALQAVRYIDETEVAEKDQRAALTALRELVTTLRDRLETADLSTRQAIFSSYPNLRLGHEKDEAVDSYELFDRDINHLIRLQDSVDRALDNRRAGASGGRPSNDLA